VVITGFPRNDVLSKPIEGKPIPNWPPELVSAIEHQRNIYFYLPTFRDSGRSYVDIDWERLEQQMLRQNALFVYKFHPMDDNRVEHSSAHITKLPQDIDLYDMLPYTSALISDYSSIIFDYMLLGRPVIYYVPDLEAFIGGERSLNFDPVDIAVGPICKNFEDLSAALMTVNEQPDIAQEQLYQSISRRLHTHADGESCARVFDMMKSRYL
jgi:CDP-glycerol glycerophosphotransferase (TagB/SpsB family)